METSVAWMVEGTLKPGKLDDLKTLLDEMVAGTSEEPGTRNYEWYISEDGTKVHGWEKYADSAATLEHVKGFGEKWADRFMDCLDMTGFSVYGTPDDSVKEYIAGWGPQYYGVMGGFAR
jgi:quinol monooxygenase YgiN